MKLETLARLVETTASPPSRGAWIEIHSRGSPPSAVWVAPLAGGVD